MPSQIRTAIYALARAWAIGALALLILGPREQTLTEVTWPLVAWAVVASVVGVRFAFSIVQFPRLRQVLSSVQPFNFTLAASAGLLVAALAYAEGFVGLWPVVSALLPACALETLMLLFSQLRRQSAG